MQREKNLWWKYVTLKKKKTRKKLNKYSVLFIANDNDTMGKMSLANEK